MNIADKTAVESEKSKNIVFEDLRLFRMRLDRDAINNDALTDPMAGGRPHESHDLTFAWVARARSRPENRSRCDFSTRRRRSKRAISSVTTVATTNTRNAWHILVFSPFSLSPSPSFFPRNRLFTFDDVSPRSLRTNPHRSSYTLSLLSIRVLLVRVIVFRGRLLSSIITNCLYYVYSWFSEVRIAGVRDETVVGISIFVQIQISVNANRKLNWNKNAACLRNMFRTFLHV